MAGLPDIHGGLRSDGKPRLQRSADGAPIPIRLDAAVRPTTSLGHSPAGFTARPFTASDLNPLYNARDPRANLGLPFGGRRGTLTFNPMDHSYKLNDGTNFWR